MSKKTVVVKIGTSSLTEKSGRLDVNRLPALTGQIGRVRRRYCSPARTFPTGAGITTPSRRWRCCSRAVRCLL